jgi:hypothetical protein
LYHWKQRNALVILPSDVDTNELPGVWKRPGSIGAQRYKTVMSRCHSQINVREVLDLSMADLTAEVHEWWDNRKWYVGFGLRRWRSHWDSEVAKIVFVRYDLDVPDEMMLLDRLDGPMIKTLEELLAALSQSQYGEMGHVVVDEQETLDELVGEWTAAHPRDEWTRERDSDEDEVLPVYDSIERHEPEFFEDEDEFDDE